VGTAEASAYDTPDSWRAEVRVKRIDLAGTPGLVVQGSKLLCGATGNCQIWIYRESGDQMSVPVRRQKTGNHKQNFR